MAQKEPVDLSQPINKLSAYADAERAKLIPKNDVYDAPSSSQALNTGLSDLL